MILSGIILSFSIFIAVSVLVCFIAIFITFIVLYFDNSKSSISFNIQDIKKLKIISPRETMESVKQYTITQVQKTDFLQMAKGMRFIFLKPMQSHLKINWKDILRTTQDDLRSFYEVL